MVHTTHIFLGNHGIHTTVYSIQTKFYTTLEMIFPSFQSNYWIHTQKRPKVHIINHGYNSHTQKCWKEISLGLLICLKNSPTILFLPNCKMWEQSHEILSFCIAKIVCNRYHTRIAGTVVKKPVLYLLEQWLFVRKCVLWEF